MFFIIAATISGGMTAGAWTLQYGIGWASVFGCLAAAASGAQAALVLRAIERRDGHERLTQARERDRPAVMSRAPPDLP